MKNISRKFFQCTLKIDPVATRLYILKIKDLLQLPKIMTYSYGIEFLYFWGSLKAVMSSK